MYDLGELLNFARHGVMAEHADHCLIDFSKGACEVIVRNPFVDAPSVAAVRSRQMREAESRVQNSSPIPPPAHHRPVITTISSAIQLQIPVSEPAATTTHPEPNASTQQRQTRATCTFCGKSFGHMGDYNKHRRRHTGERPYACDACPRRFAHASNLQRHRRLHSGEKPFECLTCAKRFSRKDKLAAHVARRCCKPSST